MRIKNILPSLLCLLTVAECFGINTKQIKAAETYGTGAQVAEDMVSGEKEHAAIYDRFLKNEEKVLIDCSGYAEDFFSFKRYEGQELVLPYIIKNRYLLSWNKLDCSSFPMNIRSISADGDYLAYDALICRLKKSIEDDNYNGQTPELTGLSYVLSWELADDDVTAGYFRKDVDGDGIDELLFGSCRNNDNEYYSSPFDCVIYDMFAIRGGKLTHVFSGAERSRYYLCENGAIANEGASSASESSWSFYKYHEGELELIEGLYTRLDSELVEHTYYNDGTKESEVDDSVVGMYSFDFRDFAKYKYQKIDYIPIIEKEK